MRVTNLVKKKRLITLCVEPTRWRVGGQDAPPCRRLRPDPGGGLVSPTSDEHSAAARRVQVRPRDAGALVGSV